MTAIVEGANGPQYVDPDDQEAMDIAYAVGLRTEMAGAASCVWSDGTNCVTLDDFKRALSEHARRMRSTTVPEKDENHSALTGGMVTVEAQSQLGQLMRQQYQNRNQIIPD